MAFKELIINKRQEFYLLCRKHNVKYIYAFGSVVNDTFCKATSDIDLIVELNEPDPVERGEKLMSLWDKLENLFNRKVDLLTDSSVHNPYLRKSIDSNKILVYDGTRPEVLV
ncbi:MAG: nucleotidyltransferase domain-containing protein [Candidatus Cloacimonetes bacterium]|nr:nucleotidyltransferase domain-containing protein [Candidatus Cloacimonadota bacterium]